MKILFTSVAKLPLAGKIIDHITPKFSVVLKQKPIALSHNTYMLTFWNFSSSYKPIPLPFLPNNPVKSQTLKRSLC